MSSQPNANQGRHAAQHTPGPWFTVQVSRCNAGAPLYAPCLVVDNKYIEQGITPSHSRELMERETDRLNAEYVAKAQP